ncbi:MAG TPA: hypothetical protein PLW48_07575 [Alphaproteobacteria bacterium]|nr:hypothetical protein [Rhodospirillaceae bacterium]HRJ66984.1 hypothetical protein [Alphaproteobacteria bacterium]
MGMKDWLKRMQENAEDKLKKADDPQAQRDAKREDNARNIRRAASAVKLAQKGLQTYNDASKKAGEIGRTVTEKTAEIAGKAQPLAGKIDETADALGKKIKGAFDVVKDKVGKGADAAGEQIGEKIDAARAEQAKKPSTGSSFLDILMPGVPETDATKPKDTPPKKPNGPNAG